jgi:hypothetical protein
MRATAHRERELIATRLEEVTEVESVALRFCDQPTHGRMVATLRTEELGHADLERIYLEHMHD